MDLFAIKTREEKTRFASVTFPNMLKSTCGPIKSALSSQHGNRIQKHQNDLDWRVDWSCLLLQGKRWQRMEFFAMHKPLVQYGRNWKLYSQFWETLSREVVLIFGERRKNNLRSFFSSPILSPLEKTIHHPKNMTKKHFIHAAKLISCIPNMEEKIAAARVFYQVAESDNPNFDRERFLAACGISGK